jgi:hypothetical protein
MRAEDILSDQQNQREFQGVIVRKGTVGAFLANARVLSDAAAPAEARAQAEQDIVADLPALRALGLFEVLEVRDAGLRRLVEAH